ncbi:unnamed protein product [Mytilus edulis]|uniref:Uncharacterized protein n=1 Tax=Mytilus edulis TaxID=6550 RepID=A0A8S3UW32_MYTED|nr:unnamed protein product [Mytilus edulis]
MQATRPRLVIEPLQLGLAIQMHHMFGSRFLVDTLSNMGFCSSYSEVQKFETSAVISKQENTSNHYDESHCLQYVADNVDHNLCTVDGNNTFHGMGIISCITPGIEKAPIHIPRLDVTTEEILACGQINMYYYNADKHKGFASLKFPELQSLKGRVFNNSWQIDALRHVTRQLKSPIPEWSGTMQMFQKGSSTGVSDVTFLPMIDLNPSDMSCIYSTLMFVSKQASRQGRTPVITFDQPLYWKSIMITSGEECSNIIVRLGGFHTQMSFLGSIGRIMSGSGLKEVLELIYAPNAVTHMLYGKAVSRAVRGFMLVDTALHTLMTNEIFGHNVLEEHENEINHSQSIEHPLLTEACELYEHLHEEKISLQDALESQTLQAVQELLQKKRNELKQSRTSKLWLSFLDMVAILKRFLIAERTGIGCYIYQH